MLAYILGITKPGNKEITNRGRFQGLQIRARGITNRGSLRYFTSRQKDHKSEERDFKSRQRLQIEQERLKTGAGITNRCRTSLGNSPSLRLNQKKNRAEKIPFMATTN